MSTATCCAVPRWNSTSATSGIDALGGRCALRERAPTGRPSIAKGGSPGGVFALVGYPPWWGIRPGGVSALVGYPPWWGIRPGGAPALVGLTRTAFPLVFQ